MRLAMMIEALVMVKLTMKASVMVKPMINVPVMVANCHKTTRRRLIDTNWTRNEAKLRGSKRRMGGREGKQHLLVIGEEK